MKKVDEKKQIKLGFLFLLILLIYMYSFSIFVSPLIYKIYPSATFSNLINKCILLISILFFIFHTVRKWKWTSQDWGFSHKNKSSWLIIIISIIFWGYFWYSSGFPTSFGIDTIKQFFTGASEELIFTVFAFILINKYLQVYRSVKPFPSKIISIILTSIFFTLIHLPSEIWTLGESITNTLSFMIYRAIYAFTGTFFFGLVAHGSTSNNQYMSLPLILIFYAIISLLISNIQRNKN